eukprot:2182785-Alexandrium_andersonii.AAC.1
MSPPACATCGRSAAASTPSGPGSAVAASSPPRSGLGSPELRPRVGGSHMRRAALPPDALRCWSLPAGWGSTSSRGPSRKARRLELQGRPL